jgi:TolB protein
MSFDESSANERPFVPSTHTPQPPEPRQSRGCLFRLIVGVVIAGLVFSLGAGAFWLLRDRLMAAMTDDEPATAVTEPTPDTSTEQTTPQETAVLPTVTPSPNPVNRIVFINADGQVETAAPDGSSRRQLTDLEKTFQFPTWSPDSRQIAVIGANRGGSIIYLLKDSDDADPENPLQLYRENNFNPFYLYWSPDGQTISFLGSHLRQGMSLNLIPAKAGGEREEILRGGPIYWQWTANGEQILLHAGQSGEDARLTFLDAAGHLDEDNIALPGQFQAPGISADGRFLAFAETATGDYSQLVVVDTASGGRQEIRHAGEIAMSWSPVGNRLAFINGSPDRESFWGPLQLFNADTGELDLLSTAMVIAYFWSPDGRYIATISAPNSSQDIIAQQWGAWTSNGRSSKQLAQVHNFLLDLSVIDTLTGRGQKLLEFEPTFEFLSQFLPFFDQYALSHRIWSPDSQYLILPFSEDRQEKLYIIPKDGGAPIFFADGEIGFWSQQ